MQTGISGFSLQQAEPIVAGQQDGVFQGGRGRPASCVLRMILSGRVAPKSWVSSLVESLKTTPEPDVCHGPNGRISES